MNCYKEYSELESAIKNKLDELDTLKYYLVSYSYKDSTFKVQNANAVIDKNPFDWLLYRVERDYERNQKEKKHFENYVLLNFWELTKEQYDKMKGTIG